MTIQKTKQLMFFLNYSSNQILNFLFIKQNTKIDLQYESPIPFFNQKENILKCLMKIKILPYNLPSQALHLQKSKKKYLAF